MADQGNRQESPQEEQSLKEREYRGPDGEVHHHTHTYMEQHGEKEAGSKGGERQGDRGNQTHGGRGNPSQGHQGQQHPDINSASKQELMQVPGIGGEMADRIIQHRPYHNQQDVNRVFEVGDKRVDQIKSQLSLPSQ